MQEAIFSTLKVIELAGVLAGPSVGVFFAEYGAEVIKIENPNRGGDVTRSWKHPKESKGSKVSAYYKSINTGKKVLFLDLGVSEDLMALYDLVKNADIVISNYLPKTANKLKVTYAHLKEINNKIIFGQVLGYRSKPDKPAFDAIIQAESGFLSMNGSADGQAAKIPVALMDILTGHQLKQAILSALWMREKTGEGYYVDVALDEVAVSSLMNQSANYLHTNESPTRMGTFHPNIAPYGEVVKTKEGSEIMLAIGTDKQFLALCKALDLPDEFQQFNSNEKRLEHRTEIFKIIENHTKRYTTAELLQIFESHLIPFGKIRTVEEVFELEEYKKLIVNDLDKNSLKVVKTTVFNIGN